MNPDFRQSNADQDATFATVFPRAAELPWSVGVLTGDIKLSPEQSTFLNHCGGSGTRLNSEPVSGHLAVRCLGTAGCGNQAASVKLFPNTPECRRLANAIHRDRWATWFAREAGVGIPTAEALWSDAYGHVPTLNALVELWQFRRLSNGALREAGFRPCHPVEGDALDIVRRYLD